MCFFLARLTCFLVLVFIDTSGFEIRKVQWQRGGSNFATFCTILSNKKKVQIIPAPKQFWIWFFFCYFREPEGPPGRSVSRGRGLSSGSRLQMALPSLAPVRRARRLRGGGRVPAETADDQPGLHSPPATGQACRPVLQRVVEVHQASLSQILQIMWALLQLWVALLWIRIRIRIRNFMGYSRVRVLK